MWGGGSSTNNRDTWPVRLECWKVVTGNQPFSKFKMSTRQLTQKKKSSECFQFRHHFGDDFPIIQPLKFPSFWTKIQLWPGWCALMRHNGTQAIAQMAVGGLLAVAGWANCRMVQEIVMALCLAEGAGMCWVMCWVVWKDTSSGR